MVIEGIVTLMQAGWVCLAPDGSNFITTTAGRMACEGSEDLPDTIIVSNRSTTLLLEKVSGQFALSSDVDLYTKQRLEKLWIAGVPIPPTGISNMVEPGLITHLLPHEPGEWVRLVGPISVVTDNRLFAVVDVDATTGKLAGIPQAWHALLENELVDRVRHAESRLVSVVGSDEERELKGLVGDAGIAENSAAFQTHPSFARLAPVDVLTTPDEHGRLLKGSLATAHSFAVIVSSELSPDVLDIVLYDLQSALQRDLLIIVFWGTVPEGQQRDHERAIDGLKKLEYDSNHGKYRGRVIVNTVGLGSSFNVLISDQSGGVEVVFGSFGWLSGPRSISERHLSIRLAGCSIGARLCDFVADLASKDQRIRTSSAITSLRKAAGELRSSQTLTNRPLVPASALRTEANILFDEAAYWSAGYLMETASRSVSLFVDSVPSEKDSPIAQRLTSTAERISGRAVVIFGGAPREGDAGDSVFQRATPLALENDPNNKANVLLADDGSAIIGNRSWLQREDYHCRPYGSVVALSLQGSGVRDLLGERLGLSVAE
jgi:hypothetical protein